MPAVLGVNAVFHDPAAALVVDGVTVAAAEEERFTRRKHGKRPVPFSTWELPEESARWCLSVAGIDAADLDAIAYSYDPASAAVDSRDPMAGRWEGLRTLFAERAPQFLHTALPGLRTERFHHVAHHVAHAASAYLAAGYDRAAVLVLDGRGEQTSQLAGHVVDGRLTVLATSPLPSSLGFVYEELTAHLGYRRSSDEYKVMALASYGAPRHLERFRSLVRVRDGAIVTEPVPWTDFGSPGRGDGTLREDHADLAASVQRRVEEVVCELGDWLHERTGEDRIALAGGVALNCVANSVLYERGPFREVWVQPAAGDAGTALGAALHVAHQLGDRIAPVPSAALGRSWTDDEIEATLRGAHVRFQRPHDVAAAVADVLAADGIVAWFQGRSEFGPRALGNRSLLAHPGRADNLDRLNAVKGREQFRPVAPMVLAERAAEVFSGGPLPSPFMLFTHRVADDWKLRIPAVVHVDGSARVQTVRGDDLPLVHRLLREFDARTGLPVVVNTSLNTAGRPMVDSPRDALECFGAAPIDALAIGPFLVCR